MPRKLAWESLSDEQLLKLRFKDLGIGLKNTWLEGMLEALYAELERRDLRVRPHAWLSDEWFSPLASPGIAFPFYLAHPRLMRLERKMIIDVEGGTRAECMSILRHEAGHVVQNAFRLHRRRRWQALFGRSSTRYPTHYRPNPASRNYVQHLRLWYAQSHPDEDFAETFAVWLCPRSNWRKRYADWPALTKLQYVDELMQEIRGERPILTGRAEVDPLRSLKRTLAQHYKAKRTNYTADLPRVTDNDLSLIFSDSSRHRHALAASVFLRHNRARIRQTVSKWTGEHQLTLDAVLEDMIARCRNLKLRAVGAEPQLVMDFTVLLAAKTVHSLHGSSRGKWLAL